MQAIISDMISFLHPLSVSFLFWRRCASSTILTLFLSACGGGGSGGTSTAATEDNSLIPEGKDQAILSITKPGCSEKEFLLEFHFQSEEGKRNGQINSAHLVWKDAAPTNADVDQLSGLWWQDGEHQLAFRFSISNGAVHCEDGYLVLQVETGSGNHLREGIVNHAITPTLRVIDERPGLFLPSPIRTIDLSGATFRLEAN